MTSINNNDQQQQQYYYYQQEEYPVEEEQQVEEALPQFSIGEYEAEESYFEEYDQEMMEAVNEADYYDYIEEEEQLEQEEDQQAQEEYILDEGLLKLIVDVQSYLAEAPTDSPLFALQYKMYTYLKQRASDMGMEIPSSTTTAGALY